MKMTGLHSTSLPVYAELGLFLFVLLSVTLIPVQAPDTQQGNAPGFEQTRLPQVHYVHSE